MMRRTLANMAAFFTEQMSIDISQGINRRVQEGLFPGKAPYGYSNVRVAGRSIVEIDSTAATNVRRIFQLYAYENQTIEGVAKRLAVPRNGYPEKHEPLIDRPTWTRVQTLLGTGNNASRTMTYASELIQCAHCGHQITGETKIKKSSTGERAYCYYRCTHYVKPGHPRVRVTEHELDRQILALFDKMRIQDESVRDRIAY